MSEHFDALETRDAASREADLFARLPGVLRKAMEAQRELYPIEYAEPVHPTPDGESSGSICTELRLRCCIHLTGVAESARRHDAVPGESIWWSDEAPVPLVRGRSLCHFGDGGGPG